MLIFWRKPLKKRGVTLPVTGKMDQRTGNRISHENPIGSGNFEKMNLIYHCE